MNRRESRAYRSRAVPRVAVDRCALVAVVPAVGGPLPDAAVHVVEAERIRGKRSDRLRPFLVPWIAAVLAIGAALAHLIAPPVGGRSAATVRVFPFGFGGQAVRLARDFAEPFDVLLCIVPTEVACRAGFAGIALRRQFLARVRGHARVPLFDRHFVFADRKWIADGYVMHGLFRSIIGTAAHL